MSVLRHVFANCAMHKDDMREARRRLDAARRVLDVLPDSCDKTYCTFIVNLGLAHAFLRDRCYAEAFALLLRTTRFVKCDPFGIAAHAAMLADACLGLNQLDRALRCIRKALAMFENWEMTDNRFYSMAILTRARILARSGEYGLAVTVADHAQQSMERCEPPNSIPPSNLTSSAGSL